MIITVDGPAAAGKSTVARRLARRLGFRYLDTGAMYRALTWKALQRGADMNDPQELARMARRAELELRPDGEELRAFCDGRDVTGEIRTPEVTRNVRRVADEPAVRRVMRGMQREFARRHDLVAEGRDQGTEVFPEAEVKFYLDASVRERAERRRRDLEAAGRPAPLDEVLRQVEERDKQDRSRPVGALRRQEDMVFIDSTNLSADQVVEVMMAEVERRRPLPGRQ